jgi:mutator protein MutT
MANESITPIAIAVVVDGDNVLVGQRPEGVVLAGLWEFPGGKIESSESPADAAVRECLEETGLVVTTTGMLDQTQHTYAHGTLHLHFIVCELINRTAKLKPPFRWIKCQDLGQYEFPAANAAVVQNLISGHSSTG